MTDRMLVAGPWIGEFGWELLHWQGFVRAKAAEQAYDHIVVCSYPGRQGIYEDFATHFVPLPKSFLDKDFCPDGNSISMRFWNDRRRQQGLPAGPLTFNRRRFIEKFQAGYPQAEAFVAPLEKQYPLSSQKFVQWRDPEVEVDPKFIILVKRYRSFYSEKKNWNAGHWQQLAEWLRADGYRVKSAPNSWTESIHLFSQASLVAGGSTGGIHLASLCGVPHYVWSNMDLLCYGHERLEDRYKSLWNPLSTPCVAANIGWQPSVEQVFDGIRQAHKNIGRK